MSKKFHENVMNSVMRGTCDIHGLAASIRLRDHETGRNKQGGISMKYIKVIVGLGLIPLGVFVGSYISIGGGNGAILGGILGGTLCCILFWSGPHWPGSYSLDEQHQVNNNVNKQTIDNTVRSVQEAQVEDQIRYRGLNHRW
jgi:hypothetical protein